MLFNNFSVKMFKVILIKLHPTAPLNSLQNQIEEKLFQTRYIVMINYSKLESIVYIVVVHFLCVYGRIV